MPDPISPLGAISMGYSGAIAPDASKTQVPAGEASRENAKPSILAPITPAEEDETPKAEVALEEATQNLKDYLKHLPADLQFTRDMETGVVSFKLINPLTKEVIREFPPEEVVEMSKRLRKMAQHGHKSGVIIDTKS